jgi:hypothetical protein
MQVMQRYELGFNRYYSPRGQAQHAVDKRLEGEIVLVLLTRQERYKPPAAGS